MLTIALKQLAKKWARYRNVSPQRLKQFAEKLRFSTSVPEGVVEKTAFTARLKASPDTNL
jgi:hypothetical protein